MENGFINEFGIKIVLKSFEERVLIFTTSIENLYIFLKWQSTRGIVETINHKIHIQRREWKCKEIDNGSIEMDIQKSLKKRVIKVITSDNKT